MLQKSIPGGIKSNRIHPTTLKALHLFAKFLAFLSHEKILLRDHVITLCMVIKMKRKALVCHT